MAQSERDFVEWLRRRFPADPRRVPVGIGDDMAALRLSGDIILVTADMLMDGVDFRTAQHSPGEIGRKALAASLSDCAAMAVRPTAAVISLALPSAWSQNEAESLYLGMEPLAHEFDLSIVGGDTNRWAHPLVIDVTLLAEPWPDMEPVRRDDARPGDGVYVSGRLGGSILGHHMTFRPRVDLARALRQTFDERLHAMMDISDGISLDLARMCEASGVGAELQVDQLLLVASADAERAATIDGRAVLDHVLSDGEDFELLCAIDEPTGRGHPTMLANGEDVWTVRVGRFVDSPGLALIHADGRREPHEPRGWDHLNDPPK